MKKKEKIKNKLKSFDIILVNDKQEFIGKKATEEPSCDPDICTLVDYSSCGKTRDECGIDIS